MANNYDLAALAIAGICPNNVILYDDLGMPSIMVKIPKMTYAQLGMGDSTAVHPAFIINGTEVDEIYISKYQNIIQNSRAYSLPGVDPKCSINFDVARAACEAKGDGWHIITRMEWGLIVRWCQRNGIMPLGNNSYGKHSTESVYKAIPSYLESGKTARIATGTGPLTWYHDQTPSGIADLCGNVWEWCGGIRTVYGELQVLANNNGADAAKSQLATSTEWKAINASTGELVTPDGSGTTSGTVKMDYISGKLTYSTTITNKKDTGVSSTFANIVCDSTISDAAKLILQNLGMLMYADSELFSAHLCYFNNGAAERLFCSGGRWCVASCGLASFSGYDTRSDAGANIGFRSAYAKLPTA
jgi:hypothetical protein